MPYAITGTKKVYQGWSDLLLATVRGPDGEEFGREIEDHGAAVGVLPYDPERRVAVLVRQFRAPVTHASGEADLLECPAGLLESADPAEDARREAMEEAGLKLGVLEPVAAIWTCPGVSTERVHLFLAAFEVNDVQGAGGGLAGEHEDTTRVELPLGEVAEMADGGRLTDAKTLLLVQTLRLRRPDLFMA